MSPTGLAVIGVGYWGPNLVRTARATPEFRLEWLCDLDLERALDPRTSVRATASYEQVLADPAVGAVARAKDGMRVPVEMPAKTEENG